jgi:hypothetical protein
MESFAPLGLFNFDPNPIFQIAKWAPFDVLRLNKGTSTEQKSFSMSQFNKDK